MTLEKTIKYYEDKAHFFRQKAEEKPYRINSFAQAIPMTSTEISDCIEHAREYEHLVSLLKELKAYREAEKNNGKT